MHNGDASRSAVAAVPSRVNANSERVSQRGEKKRARFKPDLPSPRLPSARRFIYRITWNIFLCRASLCPFHSARAPSILHSPSRANAPFNTHPIGQWRGATVTAGWTPFLLQPPLVRSDQGYVYTGSLRANRASTLLGSRGWPAGVGRLCNLHREPLLFLGRIVREKRRNGERRIKDRGVVEEGLAKTGSSLCARGWLTTSLPTLLIVRARWPSVPRHCR